MRSPAIVAVCCLFISSTSEAVDLSKDQRKAFCADVKAAFTGPVWALKDLPARTGMTMGIPWLGPVAEIRPGSIKIDATEGFSSTYGSASSIWFGVRPYDTLTLTDVACDKDLVAITFDGIGGSKGRDTKVKLLDATTFAEVKDQLFTVVSLSDPNDASWPAEIRTAITSRLLVNGMTKRQAYLVVGEPLSASTSQEGGKSIEIWKPRQSEGLRMGVYAASIPSTGYPAEIRFEDGKLTGLGTSGGGVSLD